MQTRHQFCIGAYFTLGANFSGRYEVRFKKALWLPDGIFFIPQIPILILFSEGLGMENFGIFYVRLVH
jgi:hypothetical protein